MAAERGLCCRALFFSVLPVSPHSGALSLDGLAATERKRILLLHLRQSPHSFLTRLSPGPIPPSSSPHLLATAQLKFIYEHFDDTDTNRKTFDKKCSYYIDHTRMYWWYKRTNPSSLWFSQCIKGVCSPCVCVGDEWLWDEKMREKRHAAQQGRKTGGGERVYLQDIPWPRVKHRGHPRKLVFGVGVGAVVPGWTQKKTRNREVGERPAKNKHQSLLAVSPLCCLEMVGSPLDKVVVGFIYLINKS